MQELDDNALLREYVKHGSEEAFAAVVTRHVNKVYSVALRITRNPHTAEEITQAVFAILAEKSRYFGKRVILSGWLYQAARLTALTHIRSEIRRANREQEAYLRTDLNKNESDLWAQIEPLLDAGMANLSERDRYAVVLRFFNGKSLRDVGAALGANENAARMRVDRALERLRLFFTKRGITSTTAILANTISTHSVQPAPAVLAMTSIAVALAKGATASGSTLTIIKGGLKLMAWTKAKTTVVAGLGVLFVAGTTALTIQVAAMYRDYQIWSHITEADQQHLHAAPPVVSIRATKSDPRFGTAWISDGSKQMAFNKSIGRLLQNAYQVREPRIIFSGKKPEGRFDYIDSVPDHQLEALQAAIRKKFGLTGRREMRDTDVLRLKVANANAPGFHRAASPRSPNLNNTAAGLFKIRNETMANVTHSLEMYLRTPVIDETGLTGRFDASLRWDATEQDYDPEGMKEAILNQLGFELIPDHQVIEVLVVEKVK